MMLNDWKNLKLGDRVVYHYDDFDGSFTGEGVVVQKDEDHLIVQVDDVNVWLDDDVKDMFYLKTIGVIK